jgi:hypothetical protein
MNDYPRSGWNPSIKSPIDWTIKKLEEYLPRRPFAVYENGSFVVWQRSEELTVSECDEILIGVITHYPDFKVRRHPSGDFLVTFKGGVGSLVSGELMQEHVVVLKSEANSLGKLPSEIIQGSSGDGDIDLIAGLYARALLYRDAESPAVVKVCT